MITAASAAPGSLHARGSADAPVAELINVTKRYGSVVALRDVTFRVQAGEIVALLGPNGAGKTTAISLLIGLRSATAGKVRLFGSDPRNPAHRTRLGVMLQTTGVAETLTVRELICLFSAYYSAPLPLATVLGLTGLSSLADRPYGKLSGGEKQRLMFGLALCGNPDVLLLDEPTSDLDVESRLVLWDSVRHLAAEGRTVMLATHRLEEADALARRVVIIDKGEIIADGSPADLKSLVPRQYIRCSTSLPIAELKSIAGVLELRVEHDTVLLLVDRAEPVTYQLLMRDPALANLEVSKASLEEAFLTLTGLQGNQAGRSLPGRLQR